MTIKQQGGVFGRHPTFNTVTAEATNEAAGVFDRYGSDGSVVSFLKSGVALGAIGNSGTRMYIDGAGATGLQFSSGALIPRNLGAATNGIINLGGSSNRFKELYLSGSVFLGAGSGIDFSATSGTGTSELFDDYEEGTWTATVGCTGNATTTTTVTAYYTKIGRQVTVSFRDLNDIDTTGLSGFLTVTLPFTCISASVGFIGALIWDSLTYPVGYDLVFPYVANGGSAMAFAIGGSGIADSLLDVSAVTSGTTDLKYATMTYFTA